MKEQEIITAIDMYLQGNDSTTISRVTGIDDVLIYILALRSLGAKIPVIGEHHYDFYSTHKYRTLIDTINDQNYLEQHFWSHEAKDNEDEKGRDEFLARELNK